MSLAPAIALTEQMLDMAQHQQWEALVSLEDQRSVFLEAYFSATQVPDIAQVVAQDIRYILDLNRQIISLAAIERQVSADAIKQQELAQRANQAYEYAKSNLGD